MMQEEFRAEREETSVGRAWKLDVCAEPATVLFQRGERRTSDIAIDLRTKPAGDIRLKDVPCFDEANRVADCFGECIGTNGVDQRSAP